ncbi:MULTISPECIES: hypothetical protein [Okeania]|uniref:hypothetical protein n=1 Tax=Microcoleaceae TaxID=1892252 RepID=UPI001F011966|nr:MULTISPECIES: hypothetical protein [Okeania]
MSWLYISYNFYDLWYTIDDNLIWIFMTTNNLRQKILERLDLLSGEQVKNLLRKWLVNSSGNLEYFEELLIDESDKKTE